MDLLAQALNQLAPKKVGIEEFAESSDYCNPTDAPLWMADLSFRPIGSIHIGDKVMGWQWQGQSRYLCESTVLAVKQRFAPVVKVTMESGRTFRCTEDHLWLTASMGRGKQKVTNDSQISGEWFCPAQVGRTLIRVIDPTVDLQHEEDIRQAAWLGGIFDGEGSAGKKGSLTIAQSDTHNPEVCQRIEETLDHFKFDWTRTDRAYSLRTSDSSVRSSGSNGLSRQMVTNFANWCQPARRHKLIEKAMGAAWRIQDKVVKIDPDNNEELVVALTTSTGNYICNGYASKNCNKNLYPGQAVLLKTIFLEELTGPEEDILTYWINGGRNGTEIAISPNVRERIEWCRAAGYPHFREVALVGGRRSSKGFCTGLAMGKIMWETLQLQDPGAHYGIAPEKEIYFSCIAGSQEQSQGRQYADFSSTVETCKAFDPYIVKSLETEIRVATAVDLRRIAQEKNRGNRIQKDIARLRGNAMAANSGTIRGLAMMAYAQPMDAKILTPEGWTTMGQLDVGQRIVGSDGKSQKVMKLHPRGKQRAFRVAFSDGSSTVCSEDHLWTFYRRGRVPKTKSLNEFVSPNASVEGELRLLPSPVIEGNHQLPLSPYLLGTMLGDGSMTQRAAKFCNDDPSIIKAICAVLPADHTMVLRGGIGYDIINARSKCNLVIRGLKEIGVWGYRGPDKFIPSQCFQMSPQDRRSLLQGLLDTDGSVNGTSVRFGSSSKGLAEGVIALVRSLGGYATLYVSDRPANSIGDRLLPMQKDFCEVCISGLSGALFRSERKLARCSDYSRYTARHRRLVEVTELESQEMQCITVSNDDGLYITDDYIVTHNCIDEIAHMLPGESKSSPNKIYEAANPSLGQFGVDGMAFLNSSPYTKIGLFYEKYVEGMLEFDPDRPVDEPAPLLDDGLDLQDRNGEPRLLVFQFPSWALYEGYQKSKHHKKLKAVLMGSPDWDLDELDEDGDSLWTEKDKQLSRTARAEEQTNPEGFKVEYRGKFAEVTDAYMEPRRIDEMFAGLPDEWVYDQTADHPEIPKLIVVPFKTNSGDQATNLFRYKFHLDPSSTTAGFGFAIAHAETIPDWKGMEEEHVVFDLIKRWEPKRFPGKVIRWPTILEEVLKYAEFFFPFEITFDQHESMQPVQELSEKLNERGIPTRVYIKPATAELNWHRWEVCKTSIYAKLVHAPNDTEDARWASQELKFLQIQGGTSKYPRVDRQEIGPVQTKDMADCVAECVNTLIGNQISNRTRERLSQSAVFPGAEGGYGIGFSGTTLRPGGAPPNLENYEFDKLRKAQQAYDSPTRGATGRGRASRRSNRARW